MGGFLASQSAFVIAAQGIWGIYMRVFGLISSMI
jgi:hypothetical protein